VITFDRGDMRMRIRYVLTTMAVAAGLAGGTAGAALADEQTEPTPEQIAARCERGQNMLERLQGLNGRLTDRIAALETKLASGELDERQTAMVERRLGKLGKHLDRLEQRIAKLEAKLAEKCSGEEEPA